MLTPAAFSSPDFVVGISEPTLNEFLTRHFQKNGSFYDRGRDSNPQNPPLFERELVHGQKRYKLQIWARVLEPLRIDLSANRQNDPRFIAWWRAAHGQDAVKAETKLPPNISLVANRVVVQLRFPRLDGIANPPYHDLDVEFKLEVKAFITLGEDAAGQIVLRLTDWQIDLTPPTQDELPWNDPKWGGPPPSTCENEVKRLRESIRDLILIGANVALDGLAKSLTRSLPLPSFDVIQGMKTSFQELRVSNDGLEVSARLEPSGLSALINRRAQNELDRFNVDSQDLDLEAILAAAPESPEAFETYLLQHLPAYRLLASRLTKLQRSSALRGRREAKIQATRGMWFEINERVFDVIAKDFLKADSADCTNWLKIDILLGYARGRACYWISLKNAFGKVSKIGTNVNIEMGCDVSAGGKLELQACVRVPCRPDVCTSWGPGLGLAGPLAVNVGVRNDNWKDNKALLLSARIGNFPGLEVYGMPPVVGDLVNKLVNFISSVAFKAFFNAVLSSVSFAIVKVPKDIPGANVKLELSRPGIDYTSPMVLLTADTRFE